MLLTQKVEDIPFDLKHRQHIVYGNDGNKIQSLCNQLIPKLTWAINESKKGKENTKNILISISDCLSSMSLVNKYGIIHDEYDISISFNKNENFTEIPEDCLSKSIPIVNIYNFEPFPLSCTDHIISVDEKGQLCNYEEKRHVYALKFQIHNNSSQALPIITHIYLFTDNLKLLCFSRYCDIELVYSPEIDDEFPNKYRLKTTVPSIPAGAVEAFRLVLVTEDEVFQYNNKLRIHILNDCYEFPFRLCRSGSTLRDSGKEN
ncbi:hypothetical protein MSMTP_0842 [Methanosarcina sp. MTP4]|uniref:hypothetical protein n=1 Tax=Methanosarcina sp. MTP4 TaxID=1434100 RepID=UPI000615DEF7|nr:hypothetical protein [Methanosarcina sp. MTP4]AKB24311.1 hypothetical protein MSMTP_0842 [Methanosarcina sp. MTP4]